MSTTENNGKTSKPYKIVTQKQVHITYSDVVKNALKLINEFEGKPEDQTQNTSKKIIIDSGLFPAPGKSKNIIYHSVIDRKCTKTFVKLSNNTTVTSDAITKVIGPQNYAILMACIATLDEKLKEKAILSLMTAPNHPKMVDIDVQTDVTACGCNFKVFDKQLHTKKSTKRKIVPYVVEDVAKKSCPEITVYNPKEIAIRRKVINISQSHTTVNQEESTSKCNSEEDNLSDGKTSKFSCPSIGESTSDLAQIIMPLLDTRITKGDPNESEQKFTESHQVEENLMVHSSRPSDRCGNDFGNMNCKVMKLEVDVDSNGKFNVTKNHDLMKPSQTFSEPVPWDGCLKNLPVQPENHFQLTNPKVMECLTLADRKKLFRMQTIIDFEHCLIADEDGYYPIHLAVIWNDLYLLQRQCHMLKVRGQSLDVYSNASDSYSALILSIMSSSDLDVVKMLLTMGSDPLLADKDGKTALHHAAEATSDEYIKYILGFICKNSRHILEMQDLWKPEMEAYSEDSLVNELMSHVFGLTDCEGYTPLMLAAKLARVDHVEEMLDRYKQQVNVRTHTAGASALYLAVEKACLDAAEKGDKSQISEVYSLTIERLIRYGADPYLETQSGHSAVNIINELNISSLNSLVKRTFTKVQLMTSLNLGFGPITKNLLEPHILIKTGDDLVREEIPKFMYKADSIDSKNSDCVDNFCKRNVVNKSVLVKNEKKLIKNEEEPHILIKTGNDLVREEIPKFMYNPVLVKTTKETINLNRNENNNKKRKNIGKDIIMDKKILYFPKNTEKIRKQGEMATRLVDLKKCSSCKIKPNIIMYNQDSKEHDLEVETEFPNKIQKFMDNIVKIPKNKFENLTNLTKIGPSIEKQQQSSIQILSNDIIQAKNIAIKNNHLLASNKPIITAPAVKPITITNNGTIIFSKSTNKSKVVAPIIVKNTKMMHNLAEKRNLINKHPKDSIFDDGNFENALENKSFPKNLPRVLARQDLVKKDNLPKGVYVVEKTKQEFEEKNHDQKNFSKINLKLESNYKKYVEELSNSDQQSLLKMKHTFHPYKIAKTIIHSKILNEKLQVVQAIVGSIPKDACLEKNISSPSIKVQSKKNMEDIITQSTEDIENEKAHEVLPIPIHGYIEDFSFDDIQTQSAEVPLEDQTSKDDVNDSRKICLELNRNNTVFAKNKVDKSGNVKELVNINEELDNLNANGDNLFTNSKRRVETIVKENGNNHESPNEMTVNDTEIVKTRKKTIIKLCRIINKPDNNSENPKDVKINMDDKAHSHENKFVKSTKVASENNNVGRKLEDNINTNETFDKIENKIVTLSNNANENDKNNENHEDKTTNVAQTLNKHEKDKINKNALIDKLYLKPYVKIERVIINNKNDVLVNKANCCKNDDENFTQKQ